MSEFVSLTLGGAALPSLYNTCIDGFNHVQAARNFGADFERAQLRLDLVQLRFSHWRESTVIHGDDSQRQHGAVIASAAEEDSVKNLLGQISAALENGRTTARRYQLPETAQQEQVPELFDGSDDTLPSFHQRVRAISRMRQRGTSLSRKFLWAISDRDRFNRMVDDVGRLVDELVGLFPPVIHEQQNRFISQEVEEIFPPASESREMERLQDTAADVDAAFSSTVEEKIRRESAGHSYRDVQADAEATMLVGNMYLSGSRPDAAQMNKTGHSYHGVRFKGKSRGVVGDQYRSKGLFD